MHFEDLIRQRYSARAFQDRAVPEPTLRAILTLAQHTPSWCNTQPWEPVVTVTPAATDRFREALWAHVQAGRRRGRIILFRCATRNPMPPVASAAAAPFTLPWASFGKTSAGRSSKR